MWAEVGRQPGEGLDGLLMLLVLLLGLMMVVLGGHFAPEVHPVSMSRRYQIGMKRWGRQKGRSMSSNHMGFKIGEKTMEEEGEEISAKSGRIRVRENKVRSGIDRRGKGQMKVLPFSNEEKNAYESPKEAPKESTKKEQKIEENTAKKKLQGRKRKSR